MDSTDTGACEHGVSGLGHHGHVDGDAIALANTEALEQVREAADLQGGLRNDAQLSASGSDEER